MTSDNILIVVVVLMVGVVIMFVAPMMFLSDDLDDVTQSQVESLLSETANEWASKGEITQSDYDTLQQKLNDLGYTFDIAIEIQFLDENPAKKSATTSGNLIGENEYYSVFTNYILDLLGEKGSVDLSTGDNIIITVDSTSDGLFAGWFGGTKISASYTAMVD